MNDRSLAQKLAWLFGVVFLLVGILGFIPGITENAPGSFAGEDSDGSLLGLFQVSILHNIAHFAFGIGILAARKHATAVTYLLVAGVAYLALFVLGLVGGLNWLPADNTDDVLHAVLAVALLGAWFVAKKEDDPAMVRTA